MREHKITEEQLKDSIFDTFSKWQDSADSNRTRTYFLQLCEQIYRWHKAFRLKNADDIGLEIATVIDRFIKKGKTINMPKDKDGFFKYLSTSIKREKLSSLRKFREVEDFIRMKESLLGRKLTDDERTQGVSKWFQNQDYIDLLNTINADGIISDPLDEYINKVDAETVLEVVKSLIEKKQERSRDCYRALFTLHCIENYKDFEYLSPILDGKMLETWQKNGEKPKQYKIYQNYHPNTPKTSAGAMASANLNEFITDIEARLKEKNP